MAVSNVRNLFAATKFVPPEVPPTYVVRAALRDRLDAGPQGGVTLVIGLPGSGKTTLVAEWLRERSALPWIWLGCDARDRDVNRFWSGLVLALHRRWSDLGTDALDLLEAHDPNYDDIVLTLVNDLAEIDGGAVVVIDDCHLAAPAMACLGDLVERLPSSVRFILTTRSYIDLPIARLRVHGRLDEIRQEQLALSEEEVALVVDRFDVRLAPKSVQRLARRTEGWIAAVLLASLSMQGMDDPDEVVGRFAASTRVVTDYLIQEVLERQPEELRAFIIEISVLTQFDASLCFEVTGRSDSDILLRRAVDENLFLIPLEEGRSFRFHELFRDLLRLRLQASDPGRRRELHLAAAAALEKRGALADALHQYLAAGDDQAVFAFVRDRVSQAYFADAGDTLNSWFGELPIEWVSGDSARMVQYALILSLMGRDDDAYRWVQRIGQLPAAELGDQRRRYEFVATLVEAFRGNAVASLDHAARARRQADPAREPLLEALPNLAIHCHLALDDIRSASEAFAESQHHPASDTIFNELLVPGAYTWVCVVEGGLRQAERLATQVLSSAERLRVPNHPAVAPALRSLGWVNYERGVIEKAEALLDRSLAIAESIRPTYALMSAVALGRVWLSLDRVDDALEMGERAGRFLAGPVDSILLDLVADLEGRAALALGSPDRAEDRARQMRPSRRRAVLEARIALACGKPHDAAALLTDPAFPPTTRRTRLHDVALRARCAYALGDKTFPSMIAKALNIGEDEHLTAALREDLLPIADAVRPHLPIHLSGFAKSVAAALDRAMSMPLPGPDTHPDALSAQERRVLRYLSSRLTQREIAGELYLSTNTVKTHVRAIFRKLDVSTRSGAVDRARRAGILR